MGLPRVSPARRNESLRRSEWAAVDWAVDEDEEDEVSEARWVEMVDGWRIRDDEDKRAGARSTRRLDGLGR